MFGPVICHGCGQRLEVPEGHRRRKLQCPGCGVMCDLPERKDRPAAAPQQTAARPARKAEPEPVEDVEVIEDVLFTAEPEAVRQPAAPKKEAAKPRRSLLRPAEPELDVSHHDDGKPYGLEGGILYQCPDCHGVVEDKEAALCPHCGFHFQTGQKAVRTYEPVRRYWEAGGWPLAKRIAFFVIGQAVVVPMAVLGMFSFGEFFVFFGPWLLFTLLTAFLLGTYDRVDLTRDRRGRVTLTKTWRVLFVQTPPQRIRLSEYEGVVCGKTGDTDFGIWLVLIGLLLFGLIPGIIWWYLMIHKDTFHVALAKDHGFPDTILYRGMNEEFAKEMAATVRKVADLPYDRNAVAG